MKAMGYRSVYQRQNLMTTDSKHSYPVADNSMPLDFTTNGPDKAGVAEQFVGY
jgi:hypothetical protein